MSKTKTANPSLILKSLATDLEAFVDIKPRSSSCKNKSSIELFLDKLDCKTGDKTQKPSSEQKLVKDINKSILIIKKHKSLKKYCLSNQDTILVAQLWSKNLEGYKRSFDYSDIMNLYNTGTNNVSGDYTTIVSLIDRSILWFDDELRTDYRINPLELIRNSYQLHTDIMFDIIGVNPIRNFWKDQSFNPETNQALVKDIVHYIDLVFNSYNELHGRLASHRALFTGKIIQSNLKPLIAKVKALPVDFPLVDLVNDTQIDNTEMSIFLLLIYFSLIRNEFMSENELLSYISMDYQDSVAKEIYITNESKLLVKNMIEFAKGEGMFSDDGYRVTKNTIKLISQKNSLLNTPVSAFFINDNRFAELSAKQTIDELILPKQLKQTLSASITKFTEPDKHDITQWGLRSSSCSATNKDMQTQTAKPRLMILLHGYPGTGKTYAAGAIANALGKPLIGIEASRLRDKYYGETQNIIKDTFTKIRLVHAKEANPPVFLLNEADQLIHFRHELNGNSASDTENAIQNIILEELETLPGIFIATTNLLTNLDEAFMRRFHLKLEFEKPDYECQLKLWKLHLPDTIPWVKKIDVSCLAKHFDLTGGQIRIVVENACSEAICRKGNSQKLSLQDLIKYAELESGENRLKLTQKKIGFRM
jgi:hypothetical protein